MYKHSVQSNKISQNADARSSSRPINPIGGSVSRQNFKSSSPIQSKPFISHAVSHTASNTGKQTNKAALQSKAFQLDNLFGEIQDRNQAGANLNHANNRSKASDHSKTNNLSKANEHKPSNPKANDENKPTLSTKKRPLEPDDLTDLDKSKIRKKLEDIDWNVPIDIDSEVSEIEQFKDNTIDRLDTEFGGFGQFKDITNDQLPLDDPDLVRDITDFEFETSMNESLNAKSQPSG